MEVAELEIFSTVSNHAIVRLQGRMHPGVVIQGDSLSILVRAALRLVSMLKETSSSGEEIGEAEFLACELGECLLHYQGVLTAHSLELPYTEPLRADELPACDDT